jgi:hypothetical protein
MGFGPSLIELQQKKRFGSFSFPFLVAAVNTSTSCVSVISASLYWLCIYGNTSTLHIASFNRSYQTLPE